MGQATQVTIGLVSYWIYGERDPDALTTQLSAGEYLAASLQYNTVWAALTPDNQARALVDATRALDALAWQGQKTSSSQPLQWPRTGVTYRDGTAVDSATVPDEVVAGTYVLAAMLSQNPGLLSTTTASKANIAEVGAGTARVKYFRPLAVSVLPVEIAGLLSQFLNAGAGGGFGQPAVTGTSTESAFDSDDYLSVGLP